MTHATRFVAVVAILTGLALCVPVQGQTPFVDEIRALAEAGDAEEQFKLGIVYQQGMDVPEDDAEAVRLHRLAADQGDATAQQFLGLMYAMGRGVPQDYVQAHMWFNLAASRSTGELRDSSVRNRDRARDGMTAEQLADAQRLAREWDAAHPREP